MCALAKRLASDELAGDALAGRELGTADPQGDGRVALQRRAADLLKAPAVLLSPGQVLAGEKAPTGGEQRDQ